MEDRLASRRLQLLQIDPMMLMVWIEGRAFHMRHELPSDTSVLMVHADSSGLFLIAVLHSSAFPVVPLNEKPPVWDGPVHVSPAAYVQTVP